MFNQIISSFSNLIETTEGTTESVGDVVETVADNDWLRTGVIIGGIAGVGAIGYVAYRLFAKSKKDAVKKPFDLDEALATASDDPLAIFDLAAKVMAEGKLDCVKARLTKALAEKDLTTANRCRALINLIDMYEHNK